MNSDDMIFEVFSFLDYKFVLLNCSLISKQCSDVIINRCRFKYSGKYNRNTFKIIKSKYFKSFNDITLEYFAKRYLLNGM